MDDKKQQEEQKKALEQLKQRGSVSEKAKKAVDEKIKGLNKPFNK